MFHLLHVNLSQDSFLFFINNNNCSMLLFILARVDGFGDIYFLCNDVRMVGVVGHIRGFLERSVECFSQKSFTLRICKVIPHYI